MKGQLLTNDETAGKAVTADWGSLTWLANDELSQSRITIGRVVIRKGEQNPRHCHDSCEEVLYLLKGRLRHSVGDEAVEMVAGDTLTIGPGVMHHAVNIGDTDADMIVAYSSGRRDFRKEA